MLFLIASCLVVVVMLIVASGQAVSDTDRVCSSIDTEVDSEAARSVRPLRRAALLTSSRVASA